MSLRESVGKHDYPNGPTWGGHPPRTYYDDNVRTLYLRKNTTAEIRVLSFSAATVEEAYVKGEMRSGRNGEEWSPGRSIPAVGHLPGFNGRCVLSHFLPDTHPTRKNLLEVFDFRPYHRIVRRTDRYTQVKHVQCKFKYDLSGQTPCGHCHKGEERIIGGPRLLSLTGSQMEALLDHEARILHLPLTKDTVEFNGERVKAVSAFCGECGAEAFSEAALRAMTDEQVIARVCQGDHECSACGHVGKLQETVVWRGRTVQRGQITYKNIQLKKAPSTGSKTRTTFSSNHLPFEQLSSACHRLGYSEQMYNEARDRLQRWDFSVQSLPYGINPADFTSQERYVQVVTNSQLRDLNWVRHEDRRNYHSNPFF